MESGKGTGCRRSSRLSVFSTASVLPRGLCFRGGDPPRRLQRVPVPEAPAARLTEQCPAEAAVQGPGLPAAVPLPTHAPQQPRGTRAPRAPLGAGRVLFAPGNRQHGPFWDCQQPEAGEKSQLSEITEAPASSQARSRARPVVLAEWPWPCAYKCALGPCSI